ncbi:SGNH/GDSL hydrolase family protein [Ruegeria marina]|uniref:SGNH/GDSL hydrolase family protein n=1 Tax=Ruegeria marina TaxID=639004 RepID=UPI001FDF31CA|nr:SGNH/GDSL hydrolase family protein [Ruegeria marina]
MRRKAQLLAEPAGPRAGRAGSGPALRLLIAGDSAAAGVGVDSQDLALCGQLVSRLAQTFTVDWRVEATTGHTTSDTLARLRALPDRFDVVVTSLGVNDTTRAIPARRFAARQAALMDLLTGPLAARLVVVTSVPDMALFPALPHPLSWVLGQQSQRLDRSLANMLKRYPQAVHHRPHIPPDPAMAARDGYHPSALAYAHWAEGLARVIQAQARRI